MRGAILAAVLLAAACTPEADGTAPPPDPSVLMEADRAFNADVAQGGSEAWASWFAEDGAMMREGTGEIRGRDAVRAAVASLDAPGVRLTWDPMRAQISASGDLGWTTGGWVSEVTDSTGEVKRSYGRYVSIWHLQEDGSWKVVMDLGNPTEGPPEG